MKMIDHLNLIKSSAENQTNNSVSRRMQGWLKIFFLLLLIICLTMVGVVFVYQKNHVNRIYPGVYIGSFKLGSLTREEAKKILAPAVEEIESQGLNFIGQSEKGEKSMRIKPMLIAVTDPDLSRRIINLDLEATLDRAMAVGRRGTLIEKFNQVIVSRWHGWPILTVVQIDKNELKDNIAANFKSLEQEPRDAGFELTKNNEIKLTEDSAGYTFDLDKAISEAESNLYKIDNKSVRLKLVRYDPKIKIKDVEAMIDKINEVLALAPLTIKADDKTWQVKKNLLCQWLSIKKNKETDLVFNHDNIAAYLNSIGSEINQEALDAKFKISGDRVAEFQASRAGRALDVEGGVREIVKQILAGKSEINLKIVTTEPQVLTQDVNDLGIKELIGRGTSNFAGSPKNRRHNIAVGAKKLNGILIKPDEEFSLVKALGEINQEADFLSELVIKGDRTVPEFGGGLCQIGTTTFRATLYSGLPITARTPHSYRVVYYEPAGMDATIYQPQPDLKFINDTGHYILFQTKIDGDNLIFEFYGTSDGRKVEVEKPKIFNIVQSGEPLYIETTDLPVGEKKKLESAHAGADAEFKRTITWPDGTKKDDVWKSHYRPWREVWLVGVEKLSEPTAPTTPNNQ